MKSWLFVTVQFALIFSIAGYASVIGGAVQNTMTIAAVALGLWAILTMKLKVSIFPDVVASQKLYTGGPYKWIRHPMYTAVLLSTLAWVGNRFDTVSLLLWLALLIDLLLKLSYEELMLREKFPEYRAYANKTKRLIPGIY